MSGGTQFHMEVLQFQSITGNTSVTQKILYVFFCLSGTGSHELQGPQDLELDWER